MTASFICPVCFSSRLRDNRDDEDTIKCIDCGHVFAREFGLDDLSHSELSIAECDNLSKGVGVEDGY